MKHGWIVQKWCNSMERMVSGSLDDTPEHPNSISGRPCHLKRFILPMSPKIPEIPVQSPRAANGYYD
eukprot:scaffold364970_cov40-Prasinocladus_malaysianus.AAC.1